MSLGSVTQGGDLMLFLGGKSIAFATSHTLSISADTKETSSKDSGGKWQTSEVGILSWTAQTENLYSLTGQGNNYDDLYDAMIARKPITAIFGLEGNSTDYKDNKLGEVPNGGWTPQEGAQVQTGYTGQVIITSLELNAPNGDNATFTAQFTGVGELKKLVDTQA